MRKTQVIEVVRTKILEDLNPRITEDLCSALIRQLPNHFKFTGDVPDQLADMRLAEDSKLKPNILLVIQFSLESWGRVLQEVFKFEYDKIIIFDPDIHDFDIPRMLNELIVMGSHRMIQRIGTQYPEKVVERVKMVEVLPYGSDVPRTLLNLSGDQDLKTTRANPLAKNLAMLNGSNDSRIDLKPTAKDVTIKETKPVEKIKLSNAV